MSARLVQRQQTNTKHALVYLVVFKLGCIIHYNPLQDLQAGTIPSGILVEQLVLAVQRAVGEVSRVRHHIEYPVLSDTEPLRQSIPHSLPAPTKKHTSAHSNTQIDAQVQEPRPYHGVVGMKTPRPRPTSRSEVSGFKSSGYTPWTRRPLTEPPCTLAYQQHDKFAQVG